MMQDLDEFEVGGPLTWADPLDDSEVTVFNVYLAESRDGGSSQMQIFLGYAGVNRSYLGNVSVGSNRFDVPADTALESFTHLVIFAESSLVEQTTPAAVRSWTRMGCIIETVASVSALTFVDLDLDPVELGGYVTWSPASSPLVESYNVYLASDAVGGSRTLAAGGSIPVGRNHAMLPADAWRVKPLDLEEIEHMVDTATIIELVRIAQISDEFDTFCLVYTVSQLAEQTTPLATLLSDSFGLVENMSFMDLDLDEADLGGNLTWEAPSAIANLVTGYSVWFAQVPCQGCWSLSVENTSDTVVEVAPETPLLNWTHFLVYARSSFVEQSTPALHGIVDGIASVSQISFVDKDLEAQEIGGLLQWTAPNGDLDRVVSYDIYLSRSATGEQRSSVADVEVPATSRLIPPETATHGDGFLTIYTRSILVEQTTPVAFEISDAISVIGNISFDDFDLDQQDLGGNLSWIEPSDLSQVEHYNIYFATRCDSSDGDVSDVSDASLRTDVPYCDRSFFGTTPLGVSDSIIPPETPLGHLDATDGEWSWVSRSLAPDLAGCWPLFLGRDNFTHLLIYANSSLAEQTIPTVHEIFDMSASVSLIVFVDKDLDELQLGGQITWQAPADQSRLQDYVVSLSPDPLGTTLRYNLGVTPNEVLDLAAETSLVDYILDSRGSGAGGLDRFGDMTTFRHVGELENWVSNVTFDDFDLDESDLGGDLLWSPARTVGSQEVAKYVVYLATMPGDPNCENVVAEWCLRSYFAEAVSENVTVPPETSLENFTHWLIFTHSSLVEQSTPTPHRIFDAASSVSGIQFTDKDLDILELGGTVSWTEPAYAERVSKYNLYLSVDPAGLGRQQLSTALVPTLTLDVGPELPSAGFEFMTVYTESKLVEQTTPVALQFQDRESVATNLSFPDFDLDYDDVGGTLQWDAPQETSQVTHYVIYMVAVPSAPEDLNLVSDCEAMITEESEVFYNWSLPGFSVVGAYTQNISTICNRSFYTMVPVGTEMIDVPQNLTLSPYTHWAVYTKSSLVEQSTPASLLIYDYVANVSNITFQGAPSARSKGTEGTEGLDLDLAHLGGHLQWLEPALPQRVYSYVVYLAESAMGDQRSQVGNEVIVGRHQLLVPAETRRESYTHFVVYSKSTLAEQTTPSSLSFLDEVSLAGNVSFVDDDLDRYEIGGDLVWLQPEDDSEVTDYLVYLAQDRYGRNRSFLGNVSQGVHLFKVPADTQLLAFSHLCVFARSVLVESTTPSSVLVVDFSSSISSLHFTDLDLDPLELGGVIAWNEPGNIERVISYNVYLASDAYGAGREQVGEVLQGSQCAQPLRAETAMEEFTHLAVYSRSSLAEQSTPVALSIVDNIAQVSDIVFPDFDLDETDLGGVLEWREPADVAQVTHYDVYMIEVFEPGNCTFRNGSSMDGSCDRLAMGSSMVGVANLTIPVDTALQNYSHFAVFTRSSLVEQTTPSMHLIYDMVTSVSDIRFTDQDLDDEELGGRIHWAHPPLMQRVYTYRLYLTQWDGGARSLISELPKGVNLEDLPPETPTMPLLAIYTTSTLTEQSTPVTLTVEDKFAPVSNVSFPDFDLDETDLGGILTWSPPQDESQVERYMIYMAMFTQNASECPMSSDGASYVAVITGSMVIALSGATASQVADAVQASLSQLLGVPFSWISVSASAARRLSAMGSAVGRLKRTASAMVGSQQDTLTMGWVQPLDANAPVMAECKKLRKKLPGKIVDMIQEMAMDPRFIEEKTQEPGFIEEDKGNGTFVLTESRDYKEIPHPSLPGEAKAGGNCYPVVARYRNGLRRTVNLAWGTDIFVCSTGQSFEDLDTAMRYQNDYVKGVTKEVLEERYPAQYQIVVPVGSEAAVVTSASTLGSSLGNSLAAELVLQGVSGADVASLSVLSVSSVSVSFVLPETVSPLISANETENATILTTTLEAVVSTRTSTRTMTTTTRLRNNSDDSDAEEEEPTMTSTRSTQTTQTTSRMSNGSDDSDEQESTVSTTWTMTHEEERTSTTTRSTTSMDDADLSDWNASEEEELYNLSVPFEGWGRRLSTLSPNESAWIMCYRTYFGNVSNGTFQLDFPADTALDRYTHLLIYTASPLVEQTTPVAHLIYDMAASVSNITYQGKDLDLYELGGQIAWAEPSLMERVVGYNVYLSIGLDGSGRSQVGAEVPAGSNDIALFPEQPRGAFDFFTVFTRRIGRLWGSNLAEQTTPAYLSIEDESSYARNISFIDDDLDDGEIGGYLLWRIPEDDSEVTHYLVYLSDDEVGRNRSLLGNVTVKTHEFLVPADTDLSSYRFLTVFARSSLAEQTTPRWVEVVDTVSSVSNIAFIDKDLDWEELGGRVSWSHPPSRSRVEFYELYLASDASGANRLPWHLGSIPFNVSEVLWPPETPKESFTHFVVYTRSWLAEQTTPVAFAFEDKVSLVTDIDFPDFDLDLEDLGGTLTWLPPNDTTQVTHYMIYLAQADTSQGCSNTSYLEKQNESNVSVEFSDWCLLSHLGNTSVGAHSLFIPPDTSVPPFSHLAIYTLSSLVEQTTPMALRFFDEVASVSEIRFTDEDLDPIDLGGWIHWTPPLALRRVAWYVVDLAVDAAGPLEAQQRSQIESSVAVGTNQLLAPPDTEPLHFTRFVVYTQSSLVEQTTPVGLNFVDKFSPVRNVSFWDYDLDETDLFGDLLWEAPEDDDVVRLGGSCVGRPQYHIYMAENSTGKERSLLGIVPKGVHNFSIAAETPLVNYTHFLIYTASALAEQTTPVALLIFDAVASVSEIVFEDRDLDPLEIGGNVSWSAPLLDDRVELYRVYVANTATGVGRYQVGPDVVKPQLEMAIVPETPLPPQPYIVVYTQSALMEQTTPVWLAITESELSFNFAKQDNFASVANITFPDFDLDAGDLGGEVSWDAPQDDRLVSSYNIYVAKSVLNDPSGQCNFEVAAPFVSVISGLKLGAGTVRLPASNAAMNGSSRWLAQAAEPGPGLAASEMVISTARC
ncbi:unnamed protein product [Cladocopium goreaui]|uniref:Uncharacterized protein n=1 Tax=Cladocopium goreaui TaxID=2562237 RepID=A0A9P1FIT2_9DINO|nr:unnamed protein product [Cladocopium goreaui]